MEECTSPQGLCCSSLLSFWLFVASHQGVYLNAPLKSDLSTGEIPKTSYSSAASFLVESGLVPHSRQTVNGNIGCPGAKVLLAQIRREEGATGLGL